jgi:PIN like domain
MFSNENKTQEPNSKQRFELRPKRVTLSLQAERRRLLGALLSADCPVFLDTNILIWSFGLNKEASLAWQNWLRWLGERLVIPAWVVHEYNKHSDKPEVASPYKALPRKLQVVLDELSDSAARALDHESALKLGYLNKAEVESKLSEALRFISDLAKTVAQSDSSHQTHLLKFYEGLLDERTHSVDIHKLSLQANLEFEARASLRLSPGGEDADKPENRCGDLIIWKEILQYCSEIGQGQALFVSNDVKRDWCYAPVKLELQGGKEIPWSKDASQGARLPNPELLAEFQCHTGGNGIIFAAIEQIVEALASTVDNTLDAIRFKALAEAIRASRTPTDQAVEWIHGSQDVYDTGLRGAAWWGHSPDEVDMRLFEVWCREVMKDTKIPLEKVDWMLVFVALYL